MARKHSVNTRVAKYFLEHSRITLVALFTLVAFGAVSIFALRTSGFPSPEIKVVTVNTVYPGAASGTVLDDVTKPIESSIKSIDGIKSYSSQSLDNFSSVVVQIDDSANAEAVKAKVDSSVRSVSLPESSQKPEVGSPKISNDEYSYALISKKGGDDIQAVYKAVDILHERLEEDPEVIGVNVSGDLKQEVVVQINPQKMASSGLSEEIVTNQLRSWGLQIPVAENATFGEKNYNIVLSISGKSLDELRGLVIASPTGQSAKLSDIASVDTKFALKNDTDDVMGYRDGAKSIVDRAAIFGIDVDDNTDLSAYNTKLEMVIDTYFNPSSEEFKKLPADHKKLFSSLDLVEVYNTNADNQEQVKEVVAGLAGEKWGIPVIGWIGFAFGAIQLVFIFMMLLVSWRAALIAALAIPLCFFFSTITLLATGNELNTLTLFSLVLVIGLVVDPAIVVLEVIQRYIDKGEKGRAAVLAAIDDIGYGLFIAVVTSILVFIPFGVVSGVFGAIISYIPLTIIPALIGSYIVPLVFLSWLASVVLKRQPGKTDNEEENLWRASRWMIRTNRKLLDLNAFVRLAIVIVAAVVPFMVAGYYLGSGKVKTVQFAQPEDGKLLTMSVTKLPQASPASADESAKKLLEEVMKNPNVQFVAPIYSQGAGNVSYYIRLNDPGERPGETAKKISNDFNDSISSSSASKLYFDISISPSSAGPPSANFPVSIGIKTSDLDKQRQVSLEVTKILNQICSESGKFVINSDCANENKAVIKVDNGTGAQTNKFISVQLDRKKLQTNPVNPIALREQLASIYQLNSGEQVAKLNIDNQQIPIVIAIKNQKPDTISDIESIKVATLTGQTVELSQIATVSEVESPGSIRQVEGEAVGVVSAKVQEEYSDQQNAAMIQKLAVDEFNKSYLQKYDDGLTVEGYSEGDVASINKSFQELGVALVLAIVLTYVLLVIFFDSLSMPLVILFAIPLTFLGIFPGLAYLGGGQMGFLEIIGVIILVGLVENVAIFLIDAANRKEKEGFKPKDAIAYATGVRFRPIMLTKVMALASLTPLAILSEFYRSLSVVIICGLLVSGILSLFVTPILYIFFQELSPNLKKRLTRKKAKN